MLLRVTEDAEYQGVRVRIQGNFSNAQISLQIDIGFGDEVYPHPGKIQYPTLLNFPAPELSGYTMESTIAKKFQAMVKLGILNSRMKDFYDIWILSKTFTLQALGCQARHLPPGTSCRRANVRGLCRSHYDPSRRSKTISFRI
jgi:hypothetical protein